MHVYATDAKDRQTAPMILGILSVGAAFLLHTIWPQPPWWLDAPSVMTFYGFLYLLYDRYLWRFKFLVSLSEIPNLNGTWSGEIRSSYQGKTVPIVLHVQQTWSRISIHVEAGTSRSHSTMAALYTESSSESGLKYEYLNEPDTFAPEDMHQHRGVARLRVLPDRKSLDGDYFTGRDRLTYGSMKLHYVSRKLLGYQETQKRDSQDKGRSEESEKS